jgi:hypothetical protein
MVKEDPQLFPRRAGRYMMHYRTLKGVRERVGGTNRQRRCHRNEGVAMSPIDAGRVTDTATSLAELANSLAKLASPPPDEAEAFELDEGPPRKGHLPLFDDPSNYLG